MIDNESSGEQRSSILLILMVCVLTYGIFIPFLGIYYDETVAFYILNRLSLGHLLEFTWGQARPIYAILIWLTGSNTLIAYAMIFAFHLGNALLIQYLLRRVLKGHLLLTTLVSIIYCIYPLYWLRSTIVNIAIDGSLSFCLLSFTLGIAVVKLESWKRWLGFGIGLACVPIYFFLYELPAPLEVLRPLLFWLVLRSTSQDRKQHLRRTVVWSTPWLFLALGLISYRLFIFKNSGFYQSIGYNLPKLPNLAGNLNEQIAIHAMVLWDQLVGTWNYHLPLVGPSISLPGIVLTLLILCALFMYVFRYFDGRNRDVGAQRKLPLLVISFFGIVVMLLGQGEIFATHDIPTVDGLASRWNIVAIIGVSIFYVAAVFAICTTLFRRRAFIIATLIFCPMIGIGTILQINNIQQFVQDWEGQRQFWWQLAWRIPDLEDYTTIIVEHPYETAQRRPILIYETLTMGSLFFDNPTVSVVTTDQTVPGKWEFNNGDWNLGWSYNLNRALLVSFGDGCLEIIDPNKPLPSKVVLGPYAQSLLHALPSNPTQFIKLQTDKLFLDRLKYFQPEPPHNKCYQYEKSKLAEQLTR